MNNNDPQNECFGDKKHSRLPKDGDLASVESCLAPFNPIPAQCIDIILKLLDVDSHDVIFDLGCGDGRFLVAAASTCKCCCVGIEYNSVYVERARIAASDANVQELVTIRHSDASTADISDATIVFVYLVPEGLKIVMPKLLDAIQRGCKVVSYMFSLPGLTPSRQVLYKNFIKISVYTRSQG